MSQPALGQVELAAQQVIGHDLRSSPGLSVPTEDHRHEWKRRIDYAGLIPELSEFRDSGAWAIDAWLETIGRYDAALAYLSLFWPEFTEVDECVLLGPGVPDSYAKWRASHPNDPSAVEAVLNHRHLFDLFPTAPEPSRDVLLHLGTTLREMWSAKLRHDFPDRRFIVSFPDDFDVEIDNPEITFYTDREGVQQGGRRTAG